MDGVYKSAKSLEAALAAGPELSQLASGRLRLDTELRIVSDRMRTDSSAGSRLNESYGAYLVALKTCAVLEGVLRHQAQVDACIGPSNLNLEKKRIGLEDVEELSRVLERTQGCVHRFWAQEEELSHQSTALSTGCSDDAHSASAQDACLLKRTDMLLKSADALLYPKN
jgi:hypothetical protein